MTDSDGRSFHKDSESFDPPIGFLSQESVRAFDSRMEVGVCKNKAKRAAKYKSGPMLSML